MLTRPEAKRLHFVEANPMRLTNLNPTEGIGASGWLVELEGYRLLLDAGTHPKIEGRESLPLYRIVEPRELDAIAVSHCHHDHLGSLPIAMRHFPKAHVMMTEHSYFLVERVLHNSVNVMTRQREELGIRDYPLYSHDEVDQLAPRLQGFKYNREIEWAAHHKARAGLLSPTLEFYDAGHTLGSAGIMVRGQKETLFYTGDVCFRDQTILKAARFEDVRAEVLLIETTRGSRPTPAGFRREGEIDRLAGAIQRVLKRRGSVLLPTFALGRTQEILATLALLMRAGKLKRQAVYIGGLGRVFTEIYDLEAHRCHRQHSNLLLHEALDLQVVEPGELNRLRLKDGRLFVLTAGMMTENTPAHDLAVKMAPHERHAIFFVGYTDPETPGGRLRASVPGKEFFLSQAAGKLTRRCEIAEFALTAHAHREDMIEFVGTACPRTVVLGHGEPAAFEWFAHTIHKRWPKIKVLRPGPSQSVSI
jgi:Cft2 family RNA processing exonuclease